MSSATVDVKQIEAQVEGASEPIRRLIDAVGSVVVGQLGMVEGLVIGLLTGGHVLLEGVPGLAKTLSVSALARAIRADFKRIQFTPDLLPADLVGTLIYNPGDQTFRPRLGPIFANLVLADEVNRAPAKVQSALLEAMQERRVTIGDETHVLPEPFLVLATQNPIEQEGTYPLPEAQVDRFMLKVRVGYPAADEERTILDRMSESSMDFGGQGTGEGGEGGGVLSSVSAVIGPEEILNARRIVDSVYIDTKVKGYIVDLVRATRGGVDGPAVSGTEGLIEFGASPRATLALARAGRARAFLDGRGYVSPQDVKDVAPDVLRHRVIVSYEAEAEGLTSDDLVGRVLSGVRVP